MTLTELALQNQIDYAKVVKCCTIKNSQLKDKTVDVSVIIPVRGRIEFHKIVTEYFYHAMLESKATVTITFVEHADGPPQHYWLSKGWVNHIFIPADEKPFNKCLCHNMGVLYGPRAKFYLFHDTDILVPPDLFSKLQQNIAGKDSVQAFTQRRLLMAGQMITAQFLEGTRTPDFGNFSPHEVRHAVPGAPGGSILVTREKLFEVGLWEDCFFSGYSVEDQFFLNKLKLMGSFSSSDNPPIECIHLWHSNDHQNGTSPEDFRALDMFDEMNEQGQREYIKHRSDVFKLFSK